MMAPKKVDDITAIKKHLESLQKDIDKVLQKQTDIQKLILHIDELKEENTRMKAEMQNKDKRIKELEIKTDSLEQYTRSEDFIISGLKTTHLSYANATKQNLPTQLEIQEDDQSLEAQVVTFLSTKGVHIKSDEISACHPLKGKKKVNDIVVRVVNRKTKARILKNVKKDRALQGTNVYISEHLTRKNQEIAAICRRLRKKDKISATWVKNGKIFLKTKDKRPEDERTIIVNDKSILHTLGLEIENVFD